ncbi:hypothetical protein FG379_000855 [Cryptosporidium bovis]|uniref:uncharacterized protein n=1 Tax=Cryptosporidium bovis TaxID=310047 RepID=UPI00351A8C09|nr:hypothetical protein FG379_000855 [Cryptosporidium bovis]
MRIIDSIIVSELQDDSQTDLRNWILMPKKRVNLETYREITGVFGEIMITNYLVTLLLYLLVIISTFYQIKCQNVMNITYVISFIYSFNIQKKEKYLISNKLGDNNYSDNLPTENLIGNVSAMTSIYDLLGIVSKFSDMIDLVVFGLILCKITHLLTFSSLLLIIFVRSSTFIFQIRLFTAIKNSGEVHTENDEIAVLEDDFMLNKLFETFLSKGLFSYISTLYKVNKNTYKDGIAVYNSSHSSNSFSYVKPLKITQISDFVFTLNLYSIERKLYKYYILNKHKETHDFNISIYFIWKTLSQEILLNIAKSCFILFSNEFEKFNLIFSLILSIINTLSVFFYLFLDKKVLNDVFR